MLDDQNDPVISTDNLKFNLRTLYQDQIVLAILTSDFDENFAIKYILELYQDRFNSEINRDLCEKALQELFVEIKNELALTKKEPVVEEVPLIEEQVIVPDAKTDNKKYVILSVVGIGLLAIGGYFLYKKFNR